MESFRPFSLQYLIDGISSNVEVLNAELKSGYFPKDNTNTALWYAGKSSAVFPFLLNKQRKAVKIWYDNQHEGKQQRYNAIKILYNNLSIPYFSGARYVKEAVQIKENVHDVLVMDWVGRQNIKEYIIANIHDVNRLHALAAKLIELHKDLTKNNISHGHLTSSNIYIDANSELQLIDYDTIFIKGITTEEKVVTAYPEYVHPSQRRATVLNAKADYFSALILYLGIKVIAENPMLWGRYNIGNSEGFIFSQEDYAQLSKSPTYADIKKLNSPELNHLLPILDLYCAAESMEQVLPFYEYLQQAKPLQLKEVTETIQHQDTYKNTDKTEGIKDNKNNTTLPSVVKEPMKKVAVIMPMKKEDDIPVPASEEIGSEPPANKKRETVAPVHRKEPAKLIPVTESDLSNIWIHKDEDAASTIVKVYNATTTGSSTAIKKIEKFDAPVKTTKEEKLATSLFVEEEPGEKVKTSTNKLALFISAMVLVSVVSIYASKEKGLILNNSTPAPTNKVLTDTKEKVTPIISIPISSEQPEDISTTEPVRDQAIDITDKTGNPAAATSTIIQTGNEDSSVQPTPVAVQRPVLKEGNGIAIGEKKEAERGEKTAAEIIPSINDDILNDGTPGKGFNTGISTKKEKKNK
jgi:hypothetical protein